MRISVQGSLGSFGRFFHLFLLFNLGSLILMMSDIVRSRAWLSGAKSLELLRGSLLYLFLLSLMSASLRKFDCTRVRDWRQSCNALLTSTSTFSSQRHRFWNSQRSGASLNQKLGLFTR